jgi:aryl-alcohol dehydrogenase (NADP+)
MRRQPLGSSGIDVPEICLGTMTFGEQNTEAEAHAQLDVARDHGVDFIDVAEMYPVPPRGETQGRTEAYVGSWLARQPRDRVVLATKVTGPGRGFKWIREGELALTPANIRAALEGSLRRLRTDYVDLYQIHWPDRYVPLFGKVFHDPAEERPTVPIEDQLGVLGDLVREGKVRHVGLSNETPWGTLRFLDAARSGRGPRVVSIQNAYHLMNRTFEQGLSEVTRHENVPLLAYSPLAFGHLTGKYLGGARPEDARLIRFPGFGQRYEKPNVPAATAAYAAIAEAAGVSLATLAIAFVKSRWFVASTIVGATSVAQLAENIAAADVTLSAETLAEIDRTHLLYSNPAV